MNPVSTTAPSTPAPVPVPAGLVDQFAPDIAKLGGKLTTDPSGTSLVATFPSPAAANVAGTILRPNVVERAVNGTNREFPLHLSPAAAAQVGPADAAAAVSALDGVNSAQALEGFNMFSVLMADAAGVQRLQQLLRPQIAGLDVYIEMDAASGPVGWGSGIG